MRGELEGSQPAPRALHSPTPHRVVRVPWLNAKLGQDPDAIGEFQRLVEHVLALHVPLGNGVDIVVLQFAGDGIFGEKKEKHIC